nr:translation initiation factor IF-2 [Oryctolagus cuniculus]
MSCLRQWPGRLLRGDTEGPRSAASAAPPRVHAAESRGQRAPAHWPTCCADRQGARGSASQQGSQGLLPPPRSPRPPAGTRTRKDLAPGEGGGDPGRSPPALGSCPSSPHPPAVPPWSALGALRCSRYQPGPAAMQAMVMAMLQDWCRWLGVRARQRPAHPGLPGGL